jgi:hypothetical protein
MWAYVYKDHRDHPNKYPPHPVEMTLCFSLLNAQQPTWTVLDRVCMQAISNLTWGANCDNKDGNVYWDNLFCTKLLKNALNSQISIQEMIQQQERMMWILHGKVVHSRWNDTGFVGYSIVLLIGEPCSLYRSFKWGFVRGISHSYLGLAYSSTVGSGGKQTHAHTFVHTHLPYSPSNLFTPLASQGSETRDFFYPPFKRSFGCSSNHIINAFSSSLESSKKALP